MSDYPMLISNKLHSFRNFILQSYYFPEVKTNQNKTAIVGFSTMAVFTILIDLFFQYFIK